MNKFFLKKAIVVSLCFSVLLFAFSFGGCALSYNFDNSASYSAGNASVTEIIEGIDVDWLSGSVTFEYHTKQTVDIFETANLSLTEDNCLRWIVDKGVLKIKFFKPQNMSVGWLRKDLKICLPENFTCQYIKVNSSSASVKTAMLKADSVEFTSASGGIDLWVAQCNTAKINTSSGSVEFQSNASLETLDIKTSSGRVEVDIETVREANLNTSSGRVDFSALNANETKIGTSSASVSFEVDGYSFVEIKTLSGRIEAQVPVSVGFTAKATTSSGKINYNFECAKNGDMLVFGNGQASVNLTSSSGSINILKHD